MANEYFQPGSVPAPNAPGSSAVMRQEFASISTGFDKLPILAGHANEIVAVDGTGTKLVTNGATIGDYLTKDGVGVEFSEYEVAPYAAGAQNVVIPYSDLKMKISVS